MGTHDGLSVLLDSQKRQRLHFSPSVLMTSLQPRQAHPFFRIKAEELEEHTFLHSDLLSKDWDKMD